MTLEKPEWFELSEGDEGAPVLRKKSKKLPFIAVAAAGAIVIGGALFANANDEPNASASTSSMAVPSDPGADNSTASSYLVTQAGTYSVQVTNAAGCKDSDEIKIELDECRGVFFPTGFTPNNDRLNDGFGPVGDIASLKDFSLSVFNRWGQLIFQTNNPYQKWDGKYKGKIVPMEVLVWKSSYKLYSNDIIEKKGTVIAIQ